MQAPMCLPALHPPSPSSLPPHTVTYYLRDLSPRILTPHIQPFPILCLPTLIVLSLGSRRRKICLGVMLIRNIKWKHWCHSDTTRRLSFLRLWHTYIRTANLHRLPTTGNVSSPHNHSHTLMKWCPCWLHSYDVILRDSNGVWTKILMPANVLIC